MSFSKIKNNLYLYKEEISTSGLLPFFGRRIKKAETKMVHQIILRTKRKKTFIFNGKKYKYSLANYNFTWGNERTVEIPIAKYIIDKYKDAQILEVGNVMSHYFSIKHDVIDKYERGKGVINKDIVSFKPNKKYNLIIAISTLEHVGWEEVPQDRHKIMDAIKNLKKMLKPNGVIFITLPIGYYNPSLNKMIRENLLMFTEAYYLKRTSKLNNWVQVEWNQVKSIRYNKPYNNSNAIVVGFISDKAPTR